MHLLHIPCTVNHARTYHHHTASARLHRYSYCITHILRAICCQCRGWQHGTGQHHRLVWVQQCLQKPRGFFQRIGAMRDHHTDYLGLHQPVINAPGQLRPDCKTHVLAVNLCNLLGQQLTRAVYRVSDSGYKRLYADLRSGVANVVSGRCCGSGNRPTCTQNHDFLLRHKTCTCNFLKTG